MIKQCEICNKSFATKSYGTKRKYCFDCSPSYLKNGTSISCIRKASVHWYCNHKFRHWFYEKLAKYYQNKHLKEWLK